MEKLTKNNQYYNLTELKEIAEDADKFHALKTVFDQEGGKVLVEALITNVINGVDRLSSYADMSRDELVSLAAQITISLNTARALTRAEENMSLADEQLQEALGE